MPPKNTAARTGFTLIELLVVIAIIAILAGLLLPTLARAKQKATSVACRSNERQLAFAWNMYSDDNGDGLISFNTKGNSPSSGDIPWRYEYDQLTGFILPSGLSVQQQRTAQVQEGYKRGGLYNYAPNPGVISCPGDPRHAKPLAVITDPGPYSYSSCSGVGYLNGQEAKPKANPPTGLYRRTALDHPSARMLWVEENDSRGENEGSWNFNQGTTPAFTDASLIDSPAVFHGDSSTFNFADGHAESRRWLDAATIAYALSQDPNKYGTPPSSADTPNDGPWLGQRYPSEINP